MAMLEVEDLEMIRSFVAESKRKGGSFGDLCDGLGLEKMMQALEFLSDQLDSLCECRKIEVGTCRPCKALRLVWGEYEDDTGNEGDCP